MKIRSYLELQKQYNTLELKYETLKDQVKEDCFKTLLKVLSEQNDVEREIDRIGVENITNNVDQLRKNYLEHLTKIKKKNKDNEYV